MMKLLRSKRTLDVEFIILLQLIFYDEGDSATTVYLVLWPAKAPAFLNLRVSLQYRHDCVGRHAFAEFKSLQLFIFFGRRSRAVFSGMQSF